MKRLIQLIIIITTLLVVTVSAGAYSASQTSTATLNFTEHVSIANVSADDLVILASIGELAVTNITSSEAEILVGFFYTTLRVLNGTSNVTAPIVCIDTWTCTGWVKNGSFKYRQCIRIDTTCTSTDNEPDEVEVADQTIIIMLIPFFTAAILLTVAFLLKDREDTIAKYVLAILAISMIVPGVGFGFAALNDSPSVAAVETNLVAFLWITYVLSFVVVTYFIARLIWQLHLKKVEKLGKKLRY